MEEFGISNEKLFLEYLLDLKSNLIIENHIIETYQFIKESKLYIILYSKNNQKYIIISKKTITKGGYGNILNMIITDTIDYNKTDFKNSGLIIKTALDTKNNITNNLIENSILSILNINKYTTQVVPKLWKMFNYNNKIYTIMEKLDGTINDIFKEYRNSGYKIDESFIVSYILQIAYAIYIINREYPIFSHRDLKPNNTVYKVVSQKTITIEIENISFNYQLYGYKHYIIDYGFSCLEYKEKMLSNKNFMDKTCQSISRDMTQFIFVLYHNNESILNDNIRNYLKYLLDIDINCKLWKNRNKKTQKKQKLCQSITGIDKYLYLYLNNPSFKNRKTEPITIIKDIYHYSKTQQLPSLKNQ